MLWALSSQWGPSQLPGRDHTVGTQQTHHLLRPEGASKWSRDITQKLLRVLASPSQQMGSPTFWGMGHRAG